MCVLAEIEAQQRLAQLSEQLRQNRMPAPGATRAEMEPLLDVRVLLLCFRCNCFCHVCGSHNIRNLLDVAQYIILFLRIAMIAFFSSA